MAYQPSNINGQSNKAGSAPVTIASDDDLQGKLGIVTETAPATDTASSGLNGRLQRIAQRLSSIITALGSPFQAGGSIGNTTFASTIADGADTTLGAKADAKSSATDTTAVSAMAVLKQISASVQAPPSQAVTNAGTFAVQATPVTQADTFMLGGMNVKEINGVTPLMGAGNTGTGSPRVTIATDQATIPVSLASVPSHAVTNAGTFAVQDSEKIADNAGFTDGTTKLLPTGYIFDEVAGTALTENDIAAARINLNRAQVNTIEDGATRGRYATVTAANAVKVDGSGVTQPVSLASVPSHAVTNAGTFAVQAAGDVASGSSDSGSPVKVGLVAHTAAPTAVTDGQRVNAVSDKVGRQVIVTSQVRDLVSDQTTTISASTAETTIGTAIAATFLDITALMVSNTSASTSTRIDFRDTTGGSVRFSMQIPGNTTMGICPPVPIKQTTVNTNWTAQCATSTTDIRVFVQFAKNI
jgi:hypothetical protein